VSGACRSIAREHRGATAKLVHASVLATRAIVPVAVEHSAPRRVR
jgi:hypothetical protein